MESISSLTASIERKKAERKAVDAKIEQQRLVMAAARTSDSSNGEDYRQKEIARLEEIVTQTIKKIEALQNDCQKRSLGVSFLDAAKKKMELLQAKRERLAAEIKADEKALELAQLYKKAEREMQVNPRLALTVLEQLKKLKG